MGAAGSIEQHSGIYEAIMTRWSDLEQRPEFEGIHLSRPGTYEELVTMNIPTEGLERDFALVLKKEFLAISKQTNQVIDISAFDGDMGSGGGSLQAAFSARPKSARKRPKSAEAKRRRDQAKKAKESGYYGPSISSMS